MSRLLSSVALLAAIASAAAPEEAWAVPPPPSDLTVEGGSDTWHATNRFHLEWVNPTDPPVAIAAVRYRVRDPLGAIVLEARIGWATDRIYDLRVPDIPGAYTAEVWLEDTAGVEGAPAAAKLRFDDARPPSAVPREPSGWIGRTAFPHAIRVDLEQGALPLSGIRGYAVSIDRLADARPCSDPTICTDAETDLHGGIDDVSFPVADLPEGTSYVHMVAVSGAGVSSARAAHASLRVDKTDPETVLLGAPEGWVNHPVSVTAVAADGRSGMEGAGAFTAIRVDGGVPATAPGGTVGVSLIEPGTHRVAYYARDVAGNANDGAVVNGLQNLFPDSTLVRIDRDAPGVAFASVQDPADPELIRASVRDSLSGPSSSRGWIGFRQVDSGDRFTPLETKIAHGRLTARWDSEAHPPGEYEFRASAHDVAGNVAITERRADGTAMVLPNPLKPSTVLRAGFGGARRLVWHRCTRRGGVRRCRRETVSAFERRPAVRVIPYGRGTMFAGRLTTEVGTPLAGAPVQIVEAFGPGSGRRGRVSTVRTGGGGAFTLLLRPGPSRLITARFDGSRALGRSAARPVRLGVRSGVRLRLSRATARVGGRPVVFRGRVRAPRGAIPAKGKSVALQFRLPSMGWSEFRTVQTDRRGRFRYPYRFSDDDSRGIRFQFRAYVPAQNDWPYEPGGSRPVTVRGI